MEKIPTERTIYDYTIKQMKALKVHDVAYNRIVGIYAGMLRQYYRITPACAGNTKTRTSTMALKRDHPRMCG